MLSSSTAPSLSFFCWTCCRRHVAANKTTPATRATSPTNVRDAYVQRSLFLSLSSRCRRCALVSTARLLFFFEPPFRPPPSKKKKTKKQQKKQAQSARGRKRTLSDDGNALPNARQRVCPGVSKVVAPAFPRLAHARYCAIDPFVEHSI